MKRDDDDWIERTYPNGYGISADIATISSLCWDVYHKEGGKYKYVQTFETSDEAEAYVNSMKN